MASSLESPGQEQTPVAPPRRKRQSMNPKYSAAPDNTSKISQAGSTKPRRPSPPPKPRHKPEIKRTSSTPRGAACMKVEIQKSKSVEDRVKSLGPRSMAVSSNTVLRQNKSDSGIRHMRGSNSTASITKPQGAFPGKNVGASEEGAVTSSTRNEQICARRVKPQTSTKPAPPLRPSASPTKPSGTVITRRSPNRPPSSPTAPLTHKSKNATHISHLYGSTQSLPGSGTATNNRKERVGYKNMDTKRTRDDSSEHLSGNYDKLQPLEDHLSLPRSYYRKPGESHTSRKIQHDTAQPAARGPARKQAHASNKVSPAVKTVGPSSSTQKNRINTTTRKSSTPSNNYSRIPPKRPAPPVIRSPALIRKANSVGDVKEGTQIKAEQLFEDHVYQEVGKWTYQASDNDHIDSTGSEANYPYVIMSACCDDPHIYTPLALSTTEELEGQT